MAPAPNGRTAALQPSAKWAQGSDSVRFCRINDVDDALLSVYNFSGGPRGHLQLDHRRTPRI